VGCQNSAAPLTSGSTSSRPRPGRFFELRGESHPLHQPQYALPESRQCPLWGRQPSGEFPGQQRDRVSAPHRPTGALAQRSRRVTRRAREPKPALQSAARQLSTSALPINERSIEFSPGYSPSLALVGPVENPLAFGCGRAPERISRFWERGCQPCVPGGCPVLAGLGRAMTYWGSA
jgi:hypothetical protein